MSNITMINRPKERQTPIEIALQIDEQGKTTTKLLYSFLELHPAAYSRWVKSNVENNKFAELGADYFSLNMDVEYSGKGQKARNYKLTASFAKKLAMGSDSPKGEEAHDYFIMVEQNAKKFANNTNNLASLISNDPILAIRVQQIEMEQRITQIEEKANDVRQSISEVQNKVETVKEVFAPKKENWREMIVKNIVSIAESAGVEYREIWNECYNELDRSGFDMKKRLKNSQNRMEKLGYSKTAVSRLKRIDVIERDPKAKEIFTNIVSRMVLKYVI